MSMHKLTAGSGYDYLTRQVAAQDVTEKGHTGLASYYAEKGQTPGVWMGSGLIGIDGIQAGDVVTAEQMQALFGSGHHPLAQERAAALSGPDLTDRDHAAATRLGAPYKVYSSDVSTFRLEVAKRIADFASELGHPSDYPIPTDDRARIRTEVAVEFFRAQYGRDPEDSREIAATIAKHSRPRTTAVAGYDLTFSPVKSVSTLWAIADPSVAARIERAHQTAVKDALTYLESHALYTRTGTNGVRQVDVNGLVATAFTHRDSRAGDPDLHTHVAVANKVQTDDGRWLAIDGRVLFKANVTASETYNTALEKHLTADLGLRFEERPNEDSRKRPVREIVGVDSRLNEQWSARRASIQLRRGELAEEFQRTHGRPPTPVESIQLAQRATLETRDAKKAPRTLDEQRTSWHSQAAEVLGGSASVEAMVRSALSPTQAPRRLVTASWMATTAEEITATIEARRSTWQVWHVRAEAQRQVRSMDLPAADVERVVDLLVGEVLEARSVRLTAPSDGIQEPSRLRRRDASSMYTVYGAEQYTSSRVLAAEERLVAAAGVRVGRIATSEAVDLALLESTANGITFNAGQAALVRGMATSGARLQLAIAPAGAGKTTAMRALAAAWCNDGGTILGLAPSAAAAAVLRDQLDSSTDTLAKLVWSVSHGDLPEWASSIDSQTLVVIDEAGMADTLTLDAAVQFITERGGAVRLIGDDQQLAAIGAGGVLRDLDTTHGALRLTELMRFSDPAEGAASLSLRDGETESLGYYLDHDRVHVGDLATMTEDVFSAWQSDRSKGLDAIMLAPTRELVSELNRRARTHRLEGGLAGHEVQLADGNAASVGDLILTRANNRQLRMTASDWVKNGDRWTVLKVETSGDLSVQHTQNGRIVTLPDAYVRTSTELGYATTVHAAQGVSVDAMHGLATGDESRQQLYTMMTRGRLANHIYLEVVGDGDPHNAIRPDNLVPSTATDILESVLARDDSPSSASTILREQQDPRILLGQAAARYSDALYFAAEITLGTDAVAILETEAASIVPGLTERPAWPTLRAHLILLGAHDVDPVAALREAATNRELDSAADPAAVLDWRLDDSGLRHAGEGPLPWMPGIPSALRQHPTWGEYLAARGSLVEDLAESVRQAAAAGPAPSWARQGQVLPAPKVLGDVEVWRAAMQVAERDHRPTGAPQLQKSAAMWQRRQLAALTGTRTPAMQEWGPVLERVAPSVRYDDYLPVLAERLAGMSQAGLDARGLLRSALGEGTLPDDHSAAAIWWRINRRIGPAVLHEVDQTLSTTWQPRLVEILGGERALHLQRDSMWPAMVTSIDHALQRGWRIEDLLAGTQDADDCQTLVWKISVLTDPVTPEEFAGTDESALEDLPPEDMWDGVDAPVDAPTNSEWHDFIHGTSRPGNDGDFESLEPVDAVDLNADTGLQLAAMMREHMGPLDPTDEQVNTMVSRAAEWDGSPVTRERMVELNQMAQNFFAQEFATSWAADYLAERFGQDLTNHPEFAPGHAPAGWAALVTHLRERGVTDEEMVCTGLATVARTGRLIDRFRDRATFPIVHNGEILGFVARRHPDRSDQDNAGPKYLNTSDTPLFHKGAQLFGAGFSLQDADITPVLVEGPMDAIAVTLASGGSRVGLAPLGTSLTEDQAAELALLGRDPIVATDGDIAGRVAAERDYWLLAQHGLAPTVASFAEGSDPADVLTRYGHRVLVDALDQAKPLGEALLDERLTNLTGDEALDQASQVLAAQPGSQWDLGAQRVATHLSLPEGVVRGQLRTAVEQWNRDPRKIAQARVADVRAVRDRLTASSLQSPQERWMATAHELDPRLPIAKDWPALASMLEQAHREGHDVPELTRKLVDGEPLGDHPAQDLRFRLAAHLPPPADAPITPSPTASTGAAHDRRQVTHPSASANRPRR
ncbi:MobF family relaxase [Knoellia aerolata]|nr:MobF family relaxase [Knoellia aerolata]